MNDTQTTTAQTVRGCRWSRPAYLPHGTVGVDLSPELWVCVRPTRTIVRRPVSDEECAHCPHWLAADPRED